MFTFQECSMSKPSGTSWYSSVGVMNKKVGLTGIVRLKPSSVPATKPASAPMPYSSSTNEDIPPKPPTNALSLLGSYSSSDSEWYVDQQLFSAADSYHVLGTVNIFICFLYVFLFCMPVGQGRTWWNPWTQRGLCLWGEAAGAWSWQLTLIMCWV